MTWPVSDVVTTNMDAGTDSLASARADILDMADKVNQVRNHVTDFAQTVLDDATAADARATLGVDAAIQSNTYIAATASGTNSYTITPSPAISAYAAGQEFLVTFTNANTSTTNTLQISGLASPPSIVKQDSTGAYVALAVGDIPASHRSRIRMLSTTQVQLVDTVPAAAATATPQPVGTAAVGTSLKYAREDHVHAGGLTLGTPQNTTSGTSIDFTSIPSGAKRIKIMMADLSTNGTSIPIIQIGDSGGIETSGYTANGLTMDVINTTQTTGFPVSGNWGSSDSLQCVAMLELLNASTNLWVFSSQGSIPNGFRLGAGSKSLSATLDRIRLTTVNGTETFDAGSINISYE
jgi:hypothetical protein